MISRDADGRTTYNGYSVDILKVIAHSLKYE